MADFNIRPVATDIRPVQGMSLGDMINVARGAQAYQQAQQINPVELQRAQTELSRLQQLTPEEVRRAQAEANVSVQTQAPRIRGAEATAQTAETGAQSSALDFANKQTTAIASRLTGLINNPLIIASEQNPQAVDSTQLQSLVKKYGEEQASALGIPKEKADQLIQPYLDQAGANTANLRQFLKEKLLTTLDQGSRLTAMQPSGVGINTGAGGATVQTGQFGPYTPGQVLPGTQYEQQIPPTQQFVTPTGQTQLIGPMSQRQNQPVVTGLGPAQAGVLEATGAVLKEDLPRTIAEAKEAPNRIAIFQNIKKLAPEALTGPTAERRQAVASFAQMLGIDAYVLETSSTDELMKNTTLLQMAGTTDAARDLAKFANPNTKMTKEGIARVTDQLLGIEKMRLARANYLVPAQNDAGVYAQRKQAFDSISDPRLFQEMTREDVAKLKASMSQAEQQELSNKIRMAREMGVIK
jgi:hypothetical protein